ncbi:caspase Dronc-like isoform X3 [Manduca sexta]|uniref:caspase Dronc-like isoform X3 n=1 Tax=Manduca sexta TaxID=7130 RepID=UPI00188E9513|nr:caspase Dronc-like isoform X3 [Manduca sexta]
MVRVIVCHVRKMESFDTETFIVAIQNRPIIWDSRLPEYSNKVAKRKAWEEINEIINSEFGEQTNEEKNACDMRQPVSSPSSFSPQSWPAAATSPRASNDATDLSLDIPKFHVKKSAGFFQEDEKKGIKLYHTRGRYRRVLLLLSYVNFAYGTDEYRHGVEVDTKNLKYLFAEMDFQVLTYINLTLKETNETLKSLSSVLVGAEVVFTVVSSHGYEKKLNANTSIRCSDGLLTTDGNIIEFFNHKNMPQLLGVPKVFIFQVCRGVVEDYVTVNATANVNVRALSAPRPQRVAVDTATVPPGAATSSPTTPISPPVDLRPLYSDTLVVHSTVPGFVSHRDKFDGSWYIQVLCEVFAESAHDCHVEKLFKLVDERLQQKYGIQTSSVDSRGFNKKLYLHPGLYE